MPITSRFVPKGASGSVQDRHTLPENIYALFERAPPFGKVIHLRQLYDHLLPFFEEFHVIHGGLQYSLRPSWTRYYNSPQSHVIITGHVLFCHSIPQQGWYHQPSVHLFKEDARSRADQVVELTMRALRRSAPYA